MDSFVSLEPGMMIWVWVTFAVFFFLLSKFAWKPILNAIESREKHVRETIENANRANEESQHLLEEHKALMDKAEAETQKMIAESKEIAEKMREDILRKAHEEADLALQKAKKEIESQKAATLKEMKSMVSDLAVNIAEKLIQEQIKPGKQSALIDKYIDDVAGHN